MTDDQRLRLIQSIKDLEQSWANRAAEAVKLAVADIIADQAVKQRQEQSLRTSSAIDETNARREKLHSTLDEMHETQSSTEDSHLNQIQAHIQAEKNRIHVERSSDLRHRVTEKL